MMRARRELRVAPRVRKRAMFSILRYTGSKAYSISGWLGYVPPHRTYVEVFSGSGEMFFAKRSVETEVLNDLEPDLVNFLRVVRSDKLWEHLRARCLGGGHSRAAWDKAVRILSEEGGGRALRAWAYFVRLEQSFWGMASSFGGGTGETWQNRVARLESVHARLMGVNISCLDFRKCLARWDGPDTLFFLDPPAVPGTRDSRLERNYTNLLSMSDWEELLEAIIGCEGMVMLAPYEDHDIFGALRSAGWEMIFRRRKRGKRVGVSRLWMNSAAVSRLAGVDW